MQYFEKQSDDFEEIARHLQAYDAQFKQIHGGQFAGRLAQLQLGPIVCMQVELSHAIIAKGTLKKPAYVFTPVTAANHRAIWRGHTLSTRHVNVLGAHEVMDHVASNQSVSTSVIIGKSKLEELAATRWGFVLEDSLQHQIGIRPDAVSHQKLTNLVCGAFARAAAGQTIDPSEFLDQVSEQLMNAFVSIDPRLEIKVNYNTRQRVIRLSHDIIMANLHRIVTVTELCQAADCSERTLQYAFMERYGLSPKEYMVVQRLNAVRSDIKQTQPAQEVDRNG